MIEPSNPHKNFRQPPSGGCELKHFHLVGLARFQAQPPSGGCELKPAHTPVFRALCSQPPSGGCELKPIRLHRTELFDPSRLRAAVS